MVVKSSKESIDLTIVFSGVFDASGVNWSW